MIFGLVLTHGDIGEALVSQLKLMFGDVQNLEFSSTNNLSAQQITELVKEKIKDKDAIVFTDSPGSAPAVRARAALGANQFVLTGVNLPILLSFVMKRETSNLLSLADILKTDAIRSVEVMWSPSLQKPRD